MEPLPPSLLDILAGLESLDEDFPVIEDPLPEPIDLDISASVGATPSTTLRAVPLPEIGEG